MAAEFKNKMSDLMKRAWMLVKVYGLSMRDAMKKAWAVLKLKEAMKKGIVKFMYTKLNGEVRTAWGTTKVGIAQETKGSERKKNDSLVVYFDTEKQAYRSFKIANLVVL